MASADQHDHYAWLLDTAALIRAGRFEGLDTAQIAEELVWVPTLRGNWKIA